MDHKEILKKLSEIEKYAKLEKVPIIEKETVNFISNFIIKNEIKNILEIGTAIGYSAIIMALCNPKIKVTTIEKNHERYLIALKNIKDFELENQITLMYSDALETKIDGKFDLIFIDAAKAQSINFFNNYERNLEKDGYIVTDNLSFHGKVEQDVETIESKNLRSLVKKIKDYIEFLDTNDEYETTYYNIGDKISVTKKRNN